MGKREDNELLQRYFDGDLPPDERARVEAGLTEDDQLRLAALGEMRELLVNTLTTESAEIDLWPALQAHVAPSHDLARARAKRQLPKWMRSRMASFSAGVTALAAAAALLLVFRPWHAQHSDNDCDVLSLETSGSVATVFNVNDVPHGGDGPTTVIWTEEQED
jgi:anti-sigma factor RsiW